MNIIDKIIIRILILAAMRFFNNIEVTPDDDGNVTAIKMWKDEI